MLRTVITFSVLVTYRAKVTDEDYELRVTISFARLSAVISGARTVNFSARESAGIAGFRRTETEANSMTRRQVHRRNRSDFTSIHFAEFNEMTLKTRTENNPRVK